MLRWKKPGLVCSVLALNLIACDSDTHFTTVGRVNPTYASEGLEASPEYLMSFKAGSLETADLMIDTGFNLIEQKLALVQAPKTEELYQQLDRATHEDNFTQGNSGISNQQSFTIAEAGIFDLLIVIDNSSSMSPYQNRLGKTLPSLLTHISNTNWHIAVVTTTSPCLNKTADGRKVLTRADFDANPTKAQDDFKHLINVGEFGDPVEKGILIATQAMTGTGCAAESNTWLRPDSQRAMLLVTDEKNCGSASNEGCPGAPHEVASYFFNRVGTNVTVNGLFLLQEPPAANPSDPSDPNHDCENSGGYLDLPNPAEYVNLIQGSNGIYADICRSNYDAVLEQISLNVRKKINIQYELAFPAVTDATSIKIDGKPIKQFSVSGKTLTVLDAVDPGSSTITVSYKHTPVPMKKNFSPQSPFDAKTFEVLVNNERLPDDGYKFNANTGEVELKNLPAENALVKVRYRHSTPLLKAFSYTPQIVPGTLEVLVDGKPQKNVNIDAGTQRVSFSEAPPDASSIKLRYELPGDRKTDYTVLGAFPDQIESFDLIDEETGEKLEAALETDHLKVAEESVRDGRKVKAVYNLKYDIKDKVFEAKIDSAPFPHSVKVEANGQDQVCARDLTIKADQISFSCDDEDFEQVHVQYQYALDYKNTFDLKLDYSGLYDMAVYVNNQKIEDYHLLGEKLVILKKDLPPGSDIKVLVKPR